MKRFFLFLYVIVILDPYEGLDYDEINVYDFTQECHWNCIEVIEPEPEEKENQSLNYEITQLEDLLEILSY